MHPWSTSTATIPHPTEWYACGEHWSILHNASSTIYFHLLSRVITLLWMCTICVVMNLQPDDWDSLFTVGTAISLGSLALNSGEATWILRCNFWKWWGLGPGCSRNLRIYRWNIPRDRPSTDQSSDVLQWMEALSWNQIPGYNGSRWDDCTCCRSVHSQASQYVDAPLIEYTDNVWSAHWPGPRFIHLWWCWLCRFRTMGSVCST